MCLEMALLDSIDLETWSVILIDPVSGWVATEASSLESDLVCENKPTSFTVKRRASSATHSNSGWHPAPISPQKAGLNGASEQWCLLRTDIGRAWLPLL